MWNENREFVESVWPDSAKIADDVFWTIIISAHDVCSSYAPALAEGATVPDSWRLAEIFQARDIWSKFEGGNRDLYGPDDQAAPVYPLVFVARDLIRPKSSPLSRLR